MAYSVTSASSIDDVVSQIVAFAVAQAGFTNEGVVNLTGVNRYRISKGGIYWTIRSNNFGGKQHITGRMSYSINGTSDPTNTNGQYNWTVTSLWGFPGPFPNLYLFTEGTCVHAVIELTTGVFNHFSIGVIEKSDTFTGGEYVVGSLMDNQDWDGTKNVYSNIDSSYSSSLMSGGFNSKVSNQYHSYIRNIPTGGASNNESDFAPFAYSRNSQHAYGTTWNGIVQPLFDRTPNTATLRSITLPAYVQFYDFVNGLVQLGGNVPGMRIINLGYLDPGEIILNNWQVFPFVSKYGDRVSYPVTGMYGLAYKRIP